MSRNRPLPTAGSADPQRKPPNYYSWRLRWRLLLIVAVIVLLPGFLYDVAKTRWGWWPDEQIVQPDASPPLADAEQATPRVDTRLPPKQPAEADSLEPRIGGLKVPQALPEKFVGDDQADVWRRAVEDRWSRLQTDLDREQRRQLPRLLKASRDRVAPTESDRRHWAGLVQRLDELWQQYSRAALASLESLEAGERAEWSPVLKKMDEQWQQEILTALQVIAENRPLAEVQRQALADVQSVLDKLGLAAVKDNTVLRYAESDIWFRLFERLQAAEADRLPAAAIGRVGFLQLFQEPEAYRGKLVTIRGQLRLGYRITAPPNADGIKEYCVFWLKPAGGPHRPIAIYALDSPPGFPALADADRDEPPTKLQEDAEVTGFFFKNWAYPAQDQTRLAPLLLAKVPHWQPAPKQDRAAPTTAALLAVVLAAAIVSVAFAVFVHYRGQAISQSTRRLRSSRTRSQRAE